MIVTRQLGLTVQHHMRVEEHILPLIFLVVLRCKGEVVHLLPMYYQSLVDNWSSAEAGGGGMGRLVGRSVVLHIWYKWLPLLAGMGWSVLRALWS